MELSFKSQSGRSVEQLVVDLKTNLQTTQDDMLLVGEIVRAGVRERTARGVDADNTEFKPYSTKGPYYYNPSTAGGKIASVSEAHAKRTAERIHRTLKAHGLPGELSHSGVSIRFASYAEFKASFGRLNVDLYGVDPPHMLEEITVVPQSDDSVAIRLEGEGAARAQGHNTGAGRLPQRRFWAIALEDAERIVKTLRDRLLGRMRK